MPYTYTLSTVIPASPAEVYEAWLDSIAHAEMTGGGEAVMSDEVGAEISALGGHITGRNLELVAPERIVQAWRTDEFDDETEESIVTILLQVTEDGTLLTLEHSNVPDQYKSYKEGGWQSNYFEPMIAYFSEFEEDLVEPEQQPQPASLLESEFEAKDEPKPKDEPEDEDEDQHDDDEDDEEDDDDDEEDDEEDEDDEDDDEGRDHGEHTARPRAEGEPESEPEHKHKHENEPEPEVVAPRSAPARAATEAPGARVRRASGRERRTGGLSTRKAAPRAAANQRKAAAPTASVAGKAERPETNKKTAKSATNKKAAKPAAQKAARPAAKKAAKPAARKAAKSAAGKKSVAKKKTVKPSATKKAAKKSAQGSAKRRSTKTAARGSAARSRKAGRRKR